MSANTAMFLFEVADSSFDLAVVDFTAHEKVSAPYVIDVTVACEDSIPFADVMNKEALLSVLGSDGSILNQYVADIDPPDRYFHGIVRKFKQVGTNGRFNLYEAQVVPSVWRLSLRTNNRIFQDATIQDIIAKVLNEGGILSDRYEIRLQNKELTRKFCTQFQETDLHFLSRLLEEEGIFYFFEHHEDRHILVFCDTSAYYRDISGNPAIRFNTSGGMVPSGESVLAFSLSERLRPGKFTHRNYNFKTPSHDLTEQNADDAEGLEVYEFPGSYGETDRGRRLAGVRMQGVRALKEKGSGQSACCRLAPGGMFELTHHIDNALNKKYLLLEVMHGGSQPGSLAEQSQGDAAPGYGNEFLAIPASVTFRPQRLHGKPMVPGIQTARVTGPPGEEIFPDKYGRVKVQFPWDREGKGDDKTSCWLRVSQFWNGSFWGSQFIPRVGDEVLVAFINGDMDYPMIIGSAVNESTMPNYDLPANKTQSGIRTKSYPNGARDNYHELRFDDRKGAEEIYLQSEKDWNILVKNDKGQNVGHDEALHVGNNRLKTVGANQTVQVGANHTETIGANKTETVTINKAETIGVAKELSIGGLYQVSVGAAMNETVVGAKAEEVGLAKAVIVGATMTEKVVGNRSITVGQNLSATVSQNTSLKAKSIVFEADDEIVFKTGSAIISLKSSGEIVVKGGTITEQASGEIVIKGARTALN